MADDYKKLIDNSSKKLVGLKQVLRGITDGTVWCVIVSSDCEEFIRERLREGSVGREIEFRKGPAMADLGRTMKIDVGAAVVGLVR